MPEPGVPRPHRVYPEQQVALALGIKIGSLRERIERGASLRGWAPDDPGNPLGVWLVDADYADANEPRVAGAAIPSFTGPLPPLGTVSTGESLPVAPSAAKTAMASGPRTLSLPRPRRRSKERGASAPSSPTRPGNWTSPSVMSGS